MTTQIKVLRENLIKQLSGIEEDNIGIASIEFSRKKLINALKLQKDANMLTINYGLMSWHYDYQHHAPEYEWQDDDHGLSHKVETPAWYEYKPCDKKPTPCIQFTMESNGVRQTMRFAHSPITSRKTGKIETNHLNFIDSDNPVPKGVLTGIPLDTAILIRALEFALSGVAPDESIPTLCCILFDCMDDKIRIVGADGFRLPVSTIEATGISKDKILIDKLDVARLVKFLKSTTIGFGKHKYYPDTYLSVGQDNTTVYFKTENGELHFDRRDFTYPDYTQLIPKDGSKVEFIASEFLQAVKSVTEFSRDGSGIIRLIFTHDNEVGKIAISARSEENESANECPAKVEYARKIAINSKYLIDVLSHMGDQNVTMRLTDPSSPMVFECAELGFQETTMPMFTQWGPDTTEPTPKVEPEPDDISEQEPELTTEDNEHLNEYNIQTVEA
jgi:DNA polymerase III sliding clamp (beta) subunit (PCNA family)